MSVEKPIDHPPVAACWREVHQREGLSQHDDIETVLDAAAEATSLFEAAREARIRRANMLSVLTWLGIAEPAYGAATEFPPEDVDERIAMVRRGLLPDDARARDWVPAAEEADRDA